MRDPFKKQHLDEGLCASFNGVLVHLTVEDRQDRILEEIHIDNTVAAKLIRYFEEVFELEKVKEDS